VCIKMRYRTNFMADHEVDNVVKVMCEVARSSLCPDAAKPDATSRQRRPFEVQTVLL
jgi:hypothetical protein